MFKQYKLRNYHFLLILYVALLTIFGILVIGSAEESVQKKQILGFVIGVVAMIVISLLDYTSILRFYWVYYALTIILLVWVKLRGSEHGGSVRWVSILGVQFQPSEFAKILLILFFSAFFMKYQEKLNTVKILASSFLLIGVPLLLILKQPDLSTSIVTALIFIVLLYITGLSYKIILTALAVIVPTSIIGITYILSSAAKMTDPKDVDYHMIRILAWLDPDNPLWSSYADQQQKSIMAVGSGQLFGKGLDNVDATSLLNGNYIPEAQTDFIYAVIGEELGFVGTIIILVLLLLIVLECILIASKSKDLSGRLICCGMATLVGMQSAVNIGVATGMIPNTGIPLPFVSYGLTSLVSLYIGMGFVLNVGLQPKNSYKGDFL